MIFFFMAVISRGCTSEARRVREGSVGSFFPCAQTHTRRHRAQACSCEWVCGTCVWLPADSLSAGPRAECVRLSLEICASEGDFTDTHR